MLPHSAASAPRYVFIRIIFDPTGYTIGQVHEGARSMLYLILTSYLEVVALQARN